MSTVEALDSFRMGAGHWKTNHMVRGLELSALFPNLWESRGPGDWGQSPMAKDFINHAYVVKPHKTHKQGLGSFWASEHVHVPGG